jgi:hypothetical protein
MGKVADNERIKLRATFYNNIAVGLWVAGALVPYIAIFRIFQAPFKALMLGQPLPPAADQYEVLFSILTLMAAGWLAMRFRRRADAEIQKIKD